MLVVVVGGAVVARRVEVVPSRVVVVVGAVKPGDRISRSISREQDCRNRTRMATAESTCPQLLSFSATA